MKGPKKKKVEAKTDKNKRQNQVKTESERKMQKRDSL